jgi:hypothetical protein
LKTNGLQHFKMAKVQLRACKGDQNQPNDQKPLAE